MTQTLEHEAGRATGVRLARPDLYLEITQFYAEQMQLLDEGATLAWAETFTEEGVFDANGHPRPVSGRDAIARGALAARAALEAARVQHRHIIGMLTVREREDGSAYARSYATVLEIPAGGSPTVKFSTVCQDVLVRDAVTGGWLVRERRVRRDDIRPA
jgi:3-phenylpropionate/cinnamic acid dioxygenase small subunit